MRKDHCLTRPLSDHDGSILPDVAPAHLTLRDRLICGRMRAAVSVNRRGVPDVDGYAVDRLGGQHTRAASEQREHGEAEENAAHGVLLRSNRTGRGTT